MDDEASDGCLTLLFDVLVQGLLLGTGYGILKLFGRGRGEGWLVELFACALGLLTWTALGYAAFWLLARA